MPNQNKLAAIKKMQLEKNPDCYGAQKEVNKKTSANEVEQKEKTFWRRVKLFFKVK